MRKYRYFFLFSVLCGCMSFIHAQSSITGIACWGDSKTQGKQESNISYPSILQSLLDSAGVEIVVNNFGAHGEKSTEIMQRQGSFALIVQPFTIPASADKEVKISINSRLRVPEAGCNPCQIDGIEGNIRHDWTDKSQRTFYFKRSYDGTQKEITEPTAIVTNAMLNHRNEILILDIGYNGGFSSVDNYIEQYQKMIDYSECKYFIIIGRASHHYGPSTQMESAFASYFGNHYINLRDYYVTHGLDDVSLTPTETDKQDIARGIPPASLFFDEHHENVYGYTIKANIVFQKLQELGYLDQCKGM